MSICAQNKSFTKSFKYEISEAHTLELSKEMNFIYNKDKRTLEVGSGLVLIPHAVKGANYSWGTLKLYTNTHLFIIRFEGSEIEKITKFGLSMRFEGAYSNRPILLDSNPVFGSN
jgi:hypothetical protein